MPAMSETMAVRPPRFRPLRGELIDIGGRRLRAIRAGERSDRPTILCEHGAFGSGTDWAAVQSRLAAKGLYSIAYDRAGLGFSDPGPWPRDVRAIQADRDLMLERLGERGPFVLVGHSMAGLFLRYLAGRRPEQVAGLVLVDAATAETIETPVVRRALKGYARITGAWALGAGLGAGVAALVAGDKIGLAGDASIEKRRIFANPAHHRHAAEEVRHWPENSRLGREIGAYDPAWPVAVVTAAAHLRTRTPAFQAMQSAPAEASRAGYVEHVAGSNHATLLGEGYADAVVKGVEHVLTAIDAKA